MWREKLRPIQLSRQPLCEHCQILGATEAATEIDHIQRPMERAGRLVLNYARALRLTPHTRYDARAADRAASHALEFSAADDRLIGGFAKQ